MKNSNNSKNYKFLSINFVYIFYSIYKFLKSSEYEDFIKITDDYFSKFRFQLLIKSISMLSEK